MIRIITSNRRFAATKHGTIVVGLGNELCSDDAVGLLAVRRLSETAPHKADYVETGLHGVALLDLLIGYKKAIFVDAVKTNRHPPGTVIEIDPGELHPVDNPSPHFTGVPELIKLAGELKIDFPEEFRIVAMEVTTVSEMRCELTEPVAAALDEFVDRVMKCLD